MEVLKEEAAALELSKPDPSIELTTEEKMEQHAKEKEQQKKVETAVRLKEGGF